ncbi:MAG: hypothetical protein AB1576_12635 [Bacillota bacterium]|jgi:hypothetical protein
MRGFRKEEEVAEALKEYHELREAEEGKADKTRGLKQGPRILQRGERDDGRTQQKTASEFGISQQAVSKALNIARAVEEFPDLRPLAKARLFA